MNETKIKITVVWAIFCFLWAGSLGQAFYYSIQGASPKRAMAISVNNPQVLGAYTEKPRGEILNASNEIPHLTELASPENIKAKSYIVYDYQSGTVLFSKDPDSKLPIASLTKLLTALVAYNELDLNAYYSIPGGVGIKDAPVIRIGEGEEVKGIDLFNAMLVGSENDAAKILGMWATTQNQKDFVEQMNQKARDLGMSNSEFSNPMGFYSAHNYSTVNDLKKLVDETQKFSAFTLLGKKTDYTFTTKSGQEYRALATNKLIKNHSDIYAIKTGYTKESLGAMATKALIKNHPVIIIVVGSNDREGDTLRLKDAVEKNVEWE
jgi:D-alanyl-D-alanine carboxypeptidase (penicillin-binding protein 5/6)